MVGFLLQEQHLLDVKFFLNNNKDEATQILIIPNYSTNQMVLIIRLFLIMK